MRNIAWLPAGLWVAESIRLSQVARRLPWAIRHTSIERGSSLYDWTVRVKVWYEPVARLLVSRAVAAVGEVWLVLDTTPVHHRAQVVIVSLAFRRRALPLAWTWIPQGKGHSSSVKQRALPARVRQWIPEDARVVVVGDNEFGSVTLIRQLEVWSWDYVLHQKGSTLVCLPEEGHWTALEDVVQEVGQSRQYQDMLLTEKHRHSCNLVVHWQVGEKRPWILATLSVYHIGYDMLMRYLSHGKSRRIHLVSYFG